MRAVHCNWLYKVRSPEKFVRIVQKIPINLSSAKVEELRDAATVRRKYQEPKGSWAGCFASGWLALGEKSLSLCLLVGVGGMVV